MLEPRMSHLQSTSDYFTSQSSELDVYKMEANMLGKVEEEIHFTDTNPSHYNEINDSAVVSNSTKRKVIKVYNSGIKVDDQAI
jgi:hypothetical protein